MLLIFIIKGFWTIVFIFILISATFYQVFVELGNLHGTSKFIESTAVNCSDSYNRVEVLSIPVLLLTCSEDWTCNLQMIVTPCVLLGIQSEFLGHINLMFLVDKNYYYYLCFFFFTCAHIQWKNRHLTCNIRVYDFELKCRYNVYVQTNTFEKVMDTFFFTQAIVQIILLLFLYSNSFGNK